MIWIRKLLVLLDLNGILYLDQWFSFCRPIVWRWRRWMMKNTVMLHYKSRCIEWKRGTMNTGQWFIHIEKLLEKSITDPDCVNLILHIVFGWKYMHCLCQVIVSIFFGQFLTKNTHTFERNTKETNVREKIFLFFLHIIIFYSGKIHINESRFLTEIYDIFSPFEVTWNILSHVLKPNKLVKAFQRRNLGYFFS